MTAREAFARLLAENPMCREVTDPGEGFVIAGGHVKPPSPWRRRCDRTQPMVRSNHRCPKKARTSNRPHRCSCWAANGPQPNARRPAPSSPSRLPTVEAACYNPTRGAIDDAVGNGHRCRSRGRRLHRLFAGDASLVRPVLVNSKSEPKRSLVHYAMVRAGSSSRSRSRVAAPALARARP
jgi:hypothetical protein